MTLTYILLLILAIPSLGIALIRRLAMRRPTSREDAAIEVIRELAQQELRAWARRQREARR